MNNEILRAYWSFLKCPVFFTSTQALSDIRIIYVQSAPGWKHKSRSAPEISNILFLHLAEILTWGWGVELNTKKAKKG